MAHLFIFFVAVVLELPCLKENLLASATPHHMAAAALLA
jgi:hypothetical protein